MCFSVVFACLTICLSVGLEAGSQETCPATHLTYYTYLSHLGNRTWNKYGPQF